MTPEFKLYVRTAWHNLNTRTINGSRPARVIDGNNNCYLGRGIRLECSRAEFSAWCMKSWPLILSLRGAGKRPSIDRIDSHAHYTINNMRIIPLLDNVRRGGQANGINYAAKAKPFEGRKCTHCMATIKRWSFFRARRRAVEWEPVRDFAKRKFCSRECATAALNKRRWGCDVQA